MRPQDANAVIKLDISFHDAGTLHHVVLSFRGQSVSLIAGRIGFLILRRRPAITAHCGPAYQSSRARRRLMGRCFQSFD